MTAAQHTPDPLRALLVAVRPMVAMTYAEAQEKAHHGMRFMFCQCDVLNPCWDNRPEDVSGKHWGGGDACPECNLRAAIATAQQKSAWQMVPVKAPTALAPHLTPYTLDDGYLQGRDREVIEERLQERWDGILAAIANATGSTS